MPGGRGKGGNYKGDTLKPRDWRNKPRKGSKHLVLHTEAKRIETAKAPGIHLDGKSAGSTNFPFRSAEREFRKKPEAGKLLRRGWPGKKKQ